MSEWNDFFRRVVRIKSQNFIIISLSPSPSITLVEICHCQILPKLIISCCNINFRGVKGRDLRSFEIRFEFESDDSDSIRK